MTLNVITSEPQSFNNNIRLIRKSDLAKILMITYSINKKIDNLHLMK